MNASELYSLICKNPEDDGLRASYADLIEHTDAELARFIRLQLARSAFLRRGWFVFPEDDEDRLLARHRARWSRELLEFVPHGDLDRIGFDRGFPIHIYMRPDVFLEHAERLFQLAPFRYVEFCDVFEAGVVQPFPMERLLSSPYLSRFDGIAFAKINRRPGDIERLAKCPHLTRCLYLNFRTTLDRQEYVALAEGALTGKMLVVDPRYGAGERLSYEPAPGMPNHLETVFDEEWKAVERRLGYVPWLHPSHNDIAGYELRWMFEHGKLPKYPAGSPPRDEWYADLPLVEVGKSW